MKCYPSYAEELVHVSPTPLPAGTTEMPLAAVLDEMVCVRRATEEDQVGVLRQRCVADDAVVHCVRPCGDAASVIAAPLLELAHTHVSLARAFAIWQEYTCGVSAHGRKPDNSGVLETQWCLQH